MVDGPTDENTSIIKVPNERVRQLDIQDEMRNSYLTYAMSVIVSRALPDVRDGLKPSQRRILVAMNDLNLGPTGSRKKCAKFGPKKCQNPGIKIDPSLRKFLFKSLIFHTKKAAIFWLKSRSKSAPRELPS